jgi:hypothetical protein
MVLKAIPGWLAGAVMVFPLLSIIGLCAWLTSSGETNWLFWAVIPSVIWEEALEGVSTTLADSLALNFLFLLAFWLAAGALAGLAAGAIGRRLHRL